MHPRIGDPDGFASGAMRRSDRSSQMKHEDSSACKSCDAMSIRNQCRSREHRSFSPLIDGPLSRYECSDDDRHTVQPPRSLTVEPASRCWYFSGFARCSTRVRNAHHNGRPLTPMDLCVHALIDLSERRLRTERDGKASGKREAFHAFSPNECASIFF
jgi:hypothetical protein